MTKFEHNTDTREWSGHLVKQNQLGSYKDLLQLLGLGESED